MGAVDHPLRLAVGSHKAGSGRGCAMNVISWENGDTTITDYPNCADRVLATIVQRVNDTICTHRDGDLLCPACSVEVLALGHRIVGTGTHPLTKLERRRVWVRVAADQARQVAHLNPDPRVMIAIQAAEGWCDGTVSTKQCRVAASDLKSAVAAAAAAAAYAADAAIAAAAAAADAAIAAHAHDYDDDAAIADAYPYPYAQAHAYAAYASAHAADAEPAEQIALAHRAVDVWCEWAGFTPGTPDAAVTAAAVQRMLEVAQ